jgi:hypothetical protein
MNQRIVWPLAFVAGAGLLAFGLASTFAQRPPEAPPVSPVFYGRFIVAHAAAERVLVLDSATGQVYKFLEKDFRRPADLPKVDAGFRPRLYDPEKERKVEKGKE